MINEVSTRQLETMVDSHSHIIIDARPVDAYNGWALRGEKRGGHIKGAKTLPAEWIYEENWDDIVGNKDIRSDCRVAVYGYTKEDSGQVAERLLSSGFQDVSLYARFIDEWSDRDSLPMQRMARFEKLVHPGWVHQLVSGESPPGFDNDNYVICHCHYRNKPDYDIGHIPGAIALDTLALESPETWNRRSPEELERALLDLGISADTTVVVYGRYSSPLGSDPHPGSKAGHLGSIRCAALMMYAGVRDVRVLNGSIAAWSNADYPLSRDELTLTPLTEFGGKVPAWPQMFIDTPQVKAMLLSGSGNLISMRSQEEVAGRVSGYNYIFKKGCIPGAIFGNNGSDAYHMENYRNVDLTTREYHEIDYMWCAAGITADQYNVFFCGTGWRASEGFLNAYLMGWDQIAIYDGGWFEWSQDPNNPIAKGKPAQRQR